MSLAAFIIFAIAISHQNGLVNCRYYIPNCQEIFGGTSDPEKCEHHCHHEVNPECRINLSNVQPEIAGPLLKFLNSSRYLACFIADVEENSIDYIGSNVHVITVCRPGAYCHRELQGMHHSYGCGPSGGMHCHHDFCNAGHNSDNQLLQSVLHHTTTTTTTTTTATPTKTTSSTATAPNASTPLKTTAIPVTITSAALTNTPTAISTAKTTNARTTPTTNIIKTTDITSTTTPTTATDTSTSPPTITSSEPTETTKPSKTTTATLVTTATSLLSTESSTNYSIAETTTAVTVHKCYQCGSNDNNQPCSGYGLYMTGVIDCKPGLNFCQTDIFDDGIGNVQIYKRCVDENTCRTEWLDDTSDIDECINYGNEVLMEKVSCHFCCVGDGCNKKIVPDPSSLYTG